MQGEKKDKIPAKKTEIENTIVSNKKPTFLIILILFYYNQFDLYDFCYAIWISLYLKDSRVLVHSDSGPFLPPIHKKSLLLKLESLIQ